MAAQTIKRKSNGRLAIDAVESRAADTIDVSSPAFASDGSIPDTYSDYGEGRSPELSWGDVPSGTKTIAIVAEDPDAPRTVPYTHWLLYNLPATARSVSAAVPHEESPRNLEGALQGRSSKGSIGYFGPHPPTNDPPHHYHFELFCLDAPLDLTAGANRNEVLTAMSGHVLAKGEVIGTYQAPRR